MVFELSTCLNLFVNWSWIFIIYITWQVIAPRKQKACNTIFLSKLFLSISLWYTAVYGHICRCVLVFQLTEISAFWFIHPFNKLCGKFKRKKKSIADFILKTFSILLLKIFFCHLYCTKLFFLLCKSRILRKGHYYIILLIKQS